MSSPKFYEPPKDTSGNQLWVPLVIKNKDTLLGFLWGINLCSTLYDIDREALFGSLSSSRYNDITKSGKRLRTMTNSEFEKYAESLLQDGFDRCEAMNAKDGDACDLNDYVLTLTCSCGNFVGYNTEESIPDKDTFCDVCGNKIIHYTKSNKVMIYDGISGRNNEAISSLINLMTVEEYPEDLETDEDPDVKDW